MELSHQYVVSRVAQFYSDLLILSSQGVESGSCVGGWLHHCDEAIRIDSFDGTGKELSVQFNYMHLIIDLKKLSELVVEAG